MLLAPGLSGQMRTGGAVVQRACMHPSHLTHRQSPSTLLFPLCLPGGAAARTPVNLLSGKQ
eukprot:1141402-Pelagomonas_calceolata.AAC.1